MSTEMLARGPMLLIAAVASACAGLVHAAAAGSQSETSSLTVLLAVAAALQVGWAALVVIVPTRVVSGAGVCINAPMIVAWAVSRTVGWPVIDGMAQPLSVDVRDAAAAGFALVALVGACAAWLGVRAPRLLSAAPASALATVLLLGIAVPVMATEQAPDAALSHGDDAHHDDHDDVAHDDAGHDDAGHDDAGHDDAGHDDAGHDDAGHDDAGHDDAGHDDAGHGGSGGAYDPADPVISLDDPRLTENQRAAAQALLDDVTREMARFSDPASVEAEGYVSIGDGITGFEHFSHPVLRMDPITLEPSRPESIVFRVNPDGTKDMVSAMFIMPPGQGMDEVPDIAGTLTTWHDHQDLCWMGDRIVGTTDTPGECPFGEFRVGQPMLHVWLEEHPCGPFAGLEGHGGACVQHGH